MFDMHGEYKSLTEGTDAIAQSFKIAGPGDWKRRTTMLCSCHIGYLTEKNSYQ